MVYLSLIPGVRNLDLIFDLAQDPKWEGLAIDTPFITVVLFCGQSIRPDL